MGQRARKQGLTNNQKAQILLDMVNGIDQLDKRIDGAIKNRKYKIDGDKLKDFKNEMVVIAKGSKEVKNAIGASFKSIDILRKEQEAIQRVMDSRKNKMLKMLTSLAGVKPTKQVVFAGKPETRVVDFPATEKKTLL